MSRLYFQSVGDPNDQSLSQKPLRHCEENPEELRREVKRLENKVLGLISALERQQKDLEEVNGEVFVFVITHLFVQKMPDKETKNNWNFFTWFMSWELKVLEIVHELCIFS